jgi:hypothetical protein
MTNLGLCRLLGLAKIHFVRVRASDSMLPIDDIKEIVEQNRRKASFTTSSALKQFPVDVHFWLQPSSLLEIARQWLAGGPWLVMAHDT